MHIKRIKINEFRVLKNFEIKFQVPNFDTNQNNRENSNIVNVVAGINGTGKTSLLNAIYGATSNPARFISVRKRGELDVISAETSKVISDGVKIHNYQEYLEKSHSASATPSETPRLIFLTSQLSFSYKVTPQLSIKYVISQQIDNSTILGDAEFYIKEFILSRERKSHEADPLKRSEEAINQFNEQFLGTELLTKLDGLDPQQFNRPIFTNAAGDKVTIDQLSDGEKQLYGRVISLMILNPHNSTILIDEPEIALHPSWQQQIMSVYSKIGKNNQFIVATHSPQIIANTHFENLIILNKEGSKITALYPSNPPSGVDVNSILGQIMGVKNTLPKDVDALHREYRQFVKDSNENSKEAEAVKEKLLQRESNDSKFMQEMRLLIRLRGSK